MDIIYQNKKKYKSILNFNNKYNDKNKVANILICKIIFFNCYYYYYYLQLYCLCTQGEDGE